MGNYYPNITNKNLSSFGSPLIGRSYQADTLNGYRFGINTQEKDDEIYGKGNASSAEFWEYDTRLGRRWNVDPVIKEWESSYSCFSDNPIYFTDPTGEDSNPNNKDKTADESKSNSDNRKSDPRLKFIWKIVSAVVGPTRFNELKKCFQFVDFYKHPKQRKGIIYQVKKTQVKTESDRIKLKSLWGTPKEKVVDTDEGGAIVIKRFDDLDFVDILVVEDATIAGGGMATDPANINTNNDIFASSSTGSPPADGPATTPPISNQPVPVVSNTTRVRVIPNVNGGNRASVYSARVFYTRVLYRETTREYLFGIIPLFKRNSVGDWTPTRSNPQPGRKARWIAK